MSGQLFTSTKEQHAAEDTFISEDDWLALGVTHLRLDNSTPSLYVDFRLRVRSLNWPSRPWWLSC